MIKYLTRINFTIRLNMKGIFSDTFISLIMSNLKGYFSRNNSYFNYLVSFKIIDNQNNTIIHTTFMPINLRSLDYFLEKIKNLLLSIDTKTIKNFRKVYFLAFKVPIIVIFTPTEFPKGIYDILPNSMNRNDWDLLVKRYDFLKILHFNTTISKGFIDNKIILFDSIKQEQIIIHDVKENKDDDTCFLRRSNNYLIHYINGCVKATYLLKFNSQIKMV